MKITHSNIKEYNNSQIENLKDVCNFLEESINLHLKNKSINKKDNIKNNKVNEVNKIEAKIWYGSPVWFVGGNPVVAYSVRKSKKDGERISLMFFSGQSFDEKNLIAEGKFKAAEIFYTNINEIKITNLKRYIKKAIEIQWDYKNIVKRKGVLESLF